MILTPDVNVTNLKPSVALEGLPKGGHTSVKQFSGAGGGVAEEAGRTVLILFPRLKRKFV